MQVVFNGRDRETPFLLSKTSKTHANISSTPHLHVLTLHIHNATETLSLWVKIQRIKLSRGSDTTAQAQRNYTQKMMKKIILHIVVYVHVTCDVCIHHTIKQCYFVIFEA